MTGTEEQPRLREPLHRAAQVGAIDGEDQELMTLRLVRRVLVLALIADIDPSARDNARPRLAERVLEGHQARLVQREVRDRPQNEPMDCRLPRPKEVAEQGNPQRRGSDGAQPIRYPSEEPAARLQLAPRVSELTHPEAVTGWHPA